MANFQIKDFPASAGSARTDLVLTQDVSNNTRKTTIEQQALSIRGQDTVLVESMSDFPAPSGGVITFTVDCVYLINAALTTSDRFVVNDGISVLFQGYDPNLHGIIYTGTGNMITGDDVTGIGFENVFLSCPNGTGLDITPAAASEAGVFIIDSVFINCNSLGSITNIDTFAGVNFAFRDIGTGISFNNVDTLAFTFFQIKDWKNVGTTMISIAGAGEDVTISSGFFEVKANDTLFDIDSSSTIANGVVVGLGVDISSGGGVFDPTGKDQSDVNWKFTGNSNIPDSTAKAQMSLQNNVSVTAFTATSNPAKVNGTWVDTVTRFSFDSSGRLTYIGLEDTEASITGTASAVLQTGTNKDISYYFSLGNDTNNTITAFADQGGGTVRVTTGNPHGLSTSDVVAITNTTNYDDTYTITVVDSTNFDITATFVATETGNWQEVLLSSKSTNQLASTTKSSNTGIITGLMMQTNDFIELFVENNTDGTGIVVQNSNITIS